jgi:hypothetical protein
VAFFLRISYYKEKLNKIILKKLEVFHVLLGFNRGKFVTWELIEGQPYQFLFYCLLLILFTPHLAKDNSASIILVFVSPPFVC